MRKTLTCGAEVRLNTPVTPELIRAEKPDAVILALGARELRPNLPGIDGPSVVSVVDVDRGKVQVGDTVVICGGGLSGAECAMALGREGKKVLVVDRLSEAELYRNMKDFTLPIFLKQLRDNRVETLYETGVREIGPEGVLLRDAEGREWLAPCDTVVIALGLRADAAELEALKDLVPETYVIGDARKVGVIGDATNDAYRVCMEIDS